MGLDDYTLSNLSEIDSFKKDIDSERKKLLKYDKQLLVSEGKTYNSDRLGIPDDGVFILNHKGIQFDCFFKYVPNSPLYVFLNGSKTTKPPEFRRWSYYPFISGSVLNIADPMYRYYPDLFIAWYWGNNEHNYRCYISEIVDIFKKSLSSTEIIFFASSGGGAAAIQASYYLGNCKVILINPQVRLCLYEHIKTFQKIMNVDLEKNDIFNREDVVQYISNSNIYLFVENIASETDVKQLSYLSSKVDLSIKYGLTKKDNIYLWIYEAEGDDPHGRQEYHPLFHIMDDIIHGRVPKETYSGFWKINEMWYDHWMLKNKINKMETFNTCVKTEDHQKELINILVDQIIKLSNDPSTIDSKVLLSICRVSNQLSNTVLKSLLNIIEVRGRSDEVEQVCEIIKQLLPSNPDKYAGKLARMYRDGIGVDQDLNISKYYYDIAYAANSRWANELFDILWKINTPESLVDMIKLGEFESKKGNARVSGKLARAYRYGKGVQKDLNRAADLMKFAYQNNIEWASKELISILWDIGTPESLKEMEIVSKQCLSNSNKS